MTDAIAALTITGLSILGGVVPILLALVTVRKLSSRWEKGVSVYGPALSVGIVLSTFYDLLNESANLQLGVLSISQVVTVVLFVLGLTSLMFLSGKSAARRTAVVLFGWALGGIGSHGFGEGIIIGYGFISGAGAYWNLNQILSFALHKFGEGFTLGTLLLIADRVKSWTPIGLIAGLPVGLGAALGYLTGSASLSPYAFALGGGFAAYFTIRFSKFLTRENQRVFVAVAVGFLFMYLAGLLHQF